MKEFDFREIIIHLSWTIGVLILLIVIILTANLGARPDLKDTLSFAVSFASLILALIAIGQALFASNATNKSQGIIFQAAEVVRENVDTLKTVTQRLPNLVDGVHGAIRLQTETLTRSVDTVSESVAKVSERQDILLKRQEDRDENITVRPDARLPDIDPQFDYDGMTNGQQLALYIIVKAFDCEKSIDIKEVIAPFDDNYYSGVVSTVKAFNYAKIERIDNKFLVKDLGKLGNYSESIRNYFLDNSDGVHKMIVEKIDKWASGT